MSSCRSKTARIRSRGERSSSAPGLQPRWYAGPWLARLSAISSSLDRNSWYIEFFDTPAALQSASTPMWTPSR